MVDHVKRVTEFDGLDAGEQVEGVLFVQPGGAMAQMGATAGVGGLLGVGLGAWMKKRKDKAADSEVAAAGATTEGVARQFAVSGGSYVALTDRRWLVLDQSAMSGKPKEVVAALEHGTVRAVEIDKGKLMSKAMLRCSDNSAVALDVPRGNDLEGFAAAAGNRGCTVSIS